MALIFIKNKEYIVSIEYSSKAIEIQPNNFKGYYRRGDAYMKLNMLEDARINFEDALSIDSSN